MEKHGAPVGVLIFLTVCSNSVSGIPLAPGNLKMSALDGEVTVAWDPLVNVTSMARYSVQMSMHVNYNWTSVSHCEMIGVTFCDLSGLIHNYRARYRVRVHATTANGVSKWAVLKKVLPNESKLSPPSFTLRATSSSLAVAVDEKPVLRKLFEFGVTYTVFLAEIGKENKTTMAYLNNAAAEGRTTTFRSLHRGTEYCVRLSVEGNGALFPSNVSVQQCLVLPDREWYTIAVTFLSILGPVLAMIMSVLCCYLRHPEKTPFALKSLETGWSPLTVGEDNMSVVTDKGWSPSVPNAHTESWVIQRPVTLDAAVPETEEGKAQRRVSLDSGVSVGSNRATKTPGSDPASRRDSGCASMEDSRGAGTFGGATEESRPRGRWTPAGGQGKTEDRGLSGPGNTLSRWSGAEGQDSGFPPERTRLTADRYRQQGSPAARRDTGGGEREICLAPSVVTGYRRGRLPPEEAGGDGNAELPEENVTYSTNYRRKTHIQMETVVSVDDPESPSNGLHMAFDGASAPLFLPLSFLPSAKGDLGCTMNTDGCVISLCDVQLWSE
ncbi:hypothetical protein NHX12_008218 [Muraenolepis orangiensis]|uniref:Fibronectin type-III domain-containing protein n=1 Tax=Muraenolepis orangiensis TaxID=630683 RepID=A0A9Q0DKU8_9TELE|nr:hypothetical protein NHX12_008218 [Muraenolepis orangiensis]